MLSRTLIGLVVFSALVVGLLADMPDPVPDFVPVNLIRNPSFEDSIEWNYYLPGTSALTTKVARTGLTSAHLKNAKTYFYQKMLSWSPAGCYDISFYVRNMPVEGEIGFKPSNNRLAVDFNQRELTGNEWQGAHPGPNLPIKNLAAGVSFTDWKFYRFSRCLEETDEHSDLRIRFSGAGYAIDDISVVGPYCPSGSNLGFEKQDFDCWTPTGPNLGAIVVRCGQAPFAEANCYAEIGTLGTGPATAPNQIERTDVVMQNLGDDPKTFDVCFRYRFKTNEILFTAIFFNDFLNIRIRDQDGVVLSSHTIDAQDVALPFAQGGDSGWLTKCVQETVPAGKTTFASIRVRAANDDSYFLQSWGYVDGFSFTPV